MLTLFTLIICGGLWWFFVAFWVDADDRFYKWFFQVALERWFFPGGINPVHFTWFFWFCLAIVAGCFAVLTAYRRELGAVASISLVLCLVVGAFNINDHSGSFAGATTFMVEDVNSIPPSLKRLTESAVANQHGCALYTYNDMRGCVNVGAYDFEWDARVASATGALTVLSRSSGGVSNTKVLKDSLTYLYDRDGKGRWTVIRDGKNRQAVYGVASWAGQGNVDVCTFSGQNSMNKAFGGRWGKNLADEIASRYPNLFYDSDDRYGYCDGEKPVIVIPVKEQIAYNTRTAFRSAGILEITGSPSGDAQFKRVANVKPGDYPGPVYSGSLAKEQREAMGMIAGILDSVTGKFGYDPTSVATQAGNPSEYQLRDKKSGRIYWVTPMKPRGSDDQVLAAYTLIPADEATSGKLNEQRIYVLPERDPRAVNLEDLESRTRSALSRADTGFFQSGGSLVEFLPKSGDKWQVYAELGGRVVYRIEVSSDSRIVPRVIDLDNSASSEAPEPTRASACAEDLSKLNENALAQCLEDLAAELKKRQAKRSKDKPE